MLFDIVKLNPEQATQFILAVHLCLVSLGNL